MKEGAKTAGGVLLALLLLGWVLKDQDPERIAAAAARASFAGLVLSAVFNVGHNFFRVWRWRALLEPVRSGVPLRPMWSAVLIGYMTTWVLPGRLGELVRPALLSGRERLPLGPCLGSVLADRLLDGWAIVVLFAIGSWFSPIKGEGEVHVTAVRGAAALLLTLAVGALVALVVAASRRDTLAGKVAGRRGVFAWFLRAALSVSRGVDALRRPRLLLRILAHSLVAWLVIDLGTWVGVRAAGAQVSFGAILVLMPLLALGIALPTPGGVGGYHAAMSFGLSRWFGVPPEVAVSAGILMHLVITVPVIVVGFAVLKADGISWRDLRASAAEVRRLGETAP